MHLQVLLSVMNQKDFSIVENANINTDAIVINQADIFKKETFRYRNNTIQFLTFDERGVGLSRNNALMRSEADIVVFGDQDIEYVEQYEAIILNEFNSNPNADMIVFNVPSSNPNRPTYIIPKANRVRRYNCLRYGAVKMAVKMDAIRKNNIYFSLSFGGGAEYASGEDSIFIYDFIKSGLRVYSCPEIIGYVSQTSSTWFEGYNDKYFIDKGLLYKHLFPVMAPLIILQNAIKNRKTYKKHKKFTNVIKLMLSGTRKA
jgi:glycosyltransferase involved in cell wall biosynthesis